jgi:hypothetical protein
VRHYRDGELVIIDNDFYPLKWRNEKAIVLSSRQVFKDENHYRDYDIFIFKTGEETMISGRNIKSIEGDE